MKKILFLFLAALPLLSFYEVHEFYLSVTEIEYKPEKKSLQIISRVFTDDMEGLLKKRYDESVKLTSNKEHPAADKYIEDYINDRVQIFVDGKQIELNYLGKEYDLDQLVLYIEAENVKPFDKILVQNKILTGLFPDQKNIVHVENKGKTKSLLLTRSEEKGLLNFLN